MQVLHEQRWRFRQEKGAGVFVWLREGARFDTGGSNKNLTHLRPILRFRKVNDPSFKKYNSRAYPVRWLSQAALGRWIECHAFPRVWMREERPGGNTRGA